MAIGLSEAAAAAGVNRSTIYRAWKAGRVTATRTETGQIEIEPAELFRVFPPVAGQQSAQEATDPRAQVDATGDNALHDNVLAREVQLLREMLDAMQEDRDAWREQARKEGDEAARARSAPRPGCADRAWPQLGGPGGGGCV